MKAFEQAATELEDFLFEQRPLKARARKKALKRDTTLAAVLQKGEWKEFDGVVYVPERKEVFCTFYDTARKSIVLVPAIDLWFHDKVVQGQVGKFKEAYYPGT